MAQRKNSKSHSRKEGKTSPVDNKNGKTTEGGARGGPKYSMFTWIVVVALLGVWSSMAVVYFNIVDYDSVIARAQEFRMNFSHVLQGKLAAYDTDGDGDFDVDDAKALLGLRVGWAPEGRGSPGETTEPNQQAAEKPNHRPGHASRSGTPASVPGSQDVESEIQAAVPLPLPVEDHFIPGQCVCGGGFRSSYWFSELPLKLCCMVALLPRHKKKLQSILGNFPSFLSLLLLLSLLHHLCGGQPPHVLDDPGDSQHPYEEEANAIDTTGVLVEELKPDHNVVEPDRYLTSSKLTQEAEAEEQPEPENKVKPTEIPPDGAAEKRVEEQKEKVKKKKPKFLNKFDVTIKAELDAAEKLRKKGKLEEALKAFESLVQQFPQSPRARYGKAQAEDDVAEKQRSNDMLHRAVSTYGEVAELPDVTFDLLRAALKRRAERQQFLGRMRGSLATLQKLVQIFPDDVSLRNDLGVAHLLLGDNKGAKKVYEEVLAVAPDNGFAKVHYGFILKAENQIAESIPYLREGLESGEPGTDDGRFYFHLGDALQRVGDDSAYHWYERGHKQGHFASVWQRSLYNVDGLKAQPWWTPKETGYIDLMLEKNWKTIRDEALAVMDQDRGRFIPEEENLREKGDWGQYTLWQQGRKAGGACQGVPKTCSLMERFPEAIGCKRGQIKFSVMQPGTHVWPHTGPTNCRLRMHLGLVVPPGCRIRCTNQTREWNEGKVLIFDDSFEHEVWQEADRYRLIFIVDVWHPELTQYQRQTLSPI
ncbi:transcript variant X3 [Nothobranchius furzeri]|uniref:Transcript variant X3 n=1 Tax=Nothobranchius furzeri TaxID=105023 RepID=A0A9D3BNP4_NOTFU|nr:transcript variant X3 [Nothobranchius furzeri]